MSKKIRLTSLFALALILWAATVFCGSTASGSGQRHMLGWYWPFQKTQADRTATGDLRPSPDERYGTHNGYVCVVTAAANDAVRQGFLLVAAAQALIGFASNSNVLAAPFTPTPTDSSTEAKLCSSPDAQSLTATGRTNWDT